MNEYNANNTTPRWTELAQKFPGKTPHQVCDRWAKVLNPILLKGSWTGEEDRIIIEWVNQNGAKNWGALAEKLPGRISKQCRERWHNHLCPNVNKMEWTPEEDAILIEHQKLWGNKWSKIAALLPGRTDNSVKNRWNSSLKRRLERISSGQKPSFKRGRKPKRASEAPEVAETAVSVTFSVTAKPDAEKAGDIPKPDLDDSQMRLQETVFSPIKLDSPGNTPVASGKQWITSPAGSLFSPTPINWSPNQSPFWKVDNPNVSPLPGISNMMSDRSSDIAVSGIALPKLD
jgi:hypothetical protein